MYMHAALTGMQYNLKLMARKWFQTKNNNSNNKTDIDIDNSIDQKWESIWTIPFAKSIWESERGICLLKLATLCLSFNEQQQQNVEDKKSICKIVTLIVCGVVAVAPAMNWQTQLECKIIKKFNRFEMMKLHRVNRYDEWMCGCGCVCGCHVNSIHITGVVCVHQARVICS